MIPDFKVCKKCNLNKPSCEYNKKTEKKHGKVYFYLKSYCKSCQSLYRAKYGFGICECGKVKRKNSAKCKDCHNKVKHITLDEAIKKYSKHGASNHYNYIRARARLKIKENQSCQNCGYSKHIEVCHIKPISMFTEDSLIEDINSDSNLLFLCPNCHWEFDNKLLKLETILKC